MRKRGHNWGKEEKGGGVSSSGGSVERIGGKSNKSDTQNKGGEKGELAWSDNHNYTEKDPWTKRGRITVQVDTNLGCPETRDCHKQH